MPSEPIEAVAVEYTPEFKRNLRALARKYRHIRSDVQPLIENLQAGQFIGDRVQGTHYTVFKARLRNSDIQKGKSSGYRVLYHIRTPKSAVLVTIYSKLEQGDISAVEIRRILNEFGAHGSQNTTLDPEPE